MKQEKKPQTERKLKINWGWIIIGAAVGLGVMVTVKDYLVWKQAETARFGQGWGDLDKPAAALSQAYINRTAGVRMRLPEDWVVEDKLKTETPQVKEKEFLEAAKAGPFMTIFLSKSGENLTDLTDSRVSELTMAGAEMKEREYIRTENADLTILEWTENLPGGKALIKQEVWEKRGEKIVKIAMTAEESQWLDIKNTVGEIYRNLQFTN
jgi:hypothetical protein